MLITPLVDLKWEDLEILSLRSLDLGISSLGGMTEERRNEG